MGICISEKDMKAFLTGRMSDAERAQAADHFVECETCLERLVVLYEFEKANRASYPQDHTELIKRIQGYISDPAGPDNADRADAENIKKAVKKNSRRSRRRAAVSSPSKGDSESIKTGTGSLSRVRKRSDHSTIWALLGVVMFIVLAVVFFVMMGKTKKRIQPEQEHAETPVEKEPVETAEFVGQLMKAVEPGSVLIDGKAAGITKEVSEGSDVAVKAGGFGTISLEHGVILHIDGDSALKMGKADLTGDANGFSATILSGSVFAVIPADAGSSRFRIRAGSAVISGPGSEIYISVQKNIAASAQGAFSLKKEDGTEVSVVSGGAVSLPAGEEREIDTSWFTWLKQQGVRFSMASKTPVPEEKKAADTPADTETEPKEKKEPEIFGAALQGGSFKDDFETVPLKNWREIKGTWLPSGGEVRHTSTEERGFLILKNRSMEHCRISVDIKSVDGAAGVVFSYADNGYVIARWKENGTCEVVSVQGGKETVVYKEDCGRPSPERPKRFSVTVRGKRVLIEIDDKIICQTPIVDAVKTGAVGLVAENNPSVIFDNFSVTELAGGGV